MASTRNFFLEERGRIVCQSEKTAIGLVSIFHGNLPTGVSIYIIIGSRDLNNFQQIVARTTQSTMRVFATSYI